MKLFITLWAVLLTQSAEAKVYGSTIDPDPKAVSKVDFDTRAVVQVKSSDSKGPSCAAIQLEEKILLMAGHCVDAYKSSVTIPTWRQNQSTFKIAEKFVQTSPDAGGPGHELALALIQPSHCGPLKNSEKFSLSFSGSLDVMPADNKAQLATFGGSGFRYAGHDTKDGPKFGPVEYADDLQTTQLELMEKQSVAPDALYTGAKRTIEISEFPVTREMITHREGTALLDSGTGAVLVQKDKNGELIVSGVLTDTRVGKIEKAMVSIRQEGIAPIEFEITQPEVEWTDPAKSALDLASVQAELKKRGLRGKKFEISRSYQVSVDNFYSSLTDPKNREFIKNSLTELRKMRDENAGCGRTTASKK